jgi:2TM domain
MTQVDATSEEDRRQQAIKRIKAKRDFRVHLLIYVLVNSALVIIWAFASAGRGGSQGFFWPIFPMLGWGFAVVMQGYKVYRGGAITESQIAREMERRS